MTALTANPVDWAAAAILAVAMVVGILRGATSR